MSGRWRKGRGSGWIAAGVVILAVLMASEALVEAEPRHARDGQRSGARRVRSRPVATLGHTVRPGETLWMISRRHSVTVEALARANGLRAGGRIVVGQRLMIPGAMTDENHQEPPSLAEIVLGPPPESSRLGLAWPIAPSVASPFGPRRQAWHGGVDIRADRGTAIRAAAAGMVIMSGRERGYGNVIKIWHALDLMTVYAHNHENHVKVGEWVEGGQTIATVGSTGRTTAPHLHFEVRLDGKKYDPLFWLPDPDAVDVAAARAVPGMDGTSAGAIR